MVKEDMQELGAKVDCLSEIYGEYAVATSDGKAERRKMDRSTTYLFTPSTHFPPCTHGLLSHSLMLEAQM